MERKTVAVIGIIIASLLLCLGLFTKVPQKEISFYNFDGNGYEEYVGGDAYNIQIEASLRGGEIAGATAARSTYFSGAALALMLSLSLLTKEPKNKDARMLAHENINVMAEVESALNTSTNNKPESEEI